MYFVNFFNNKSILPKIYFKNYIINKPNLR